MASVFLDTSALVKRYSAEAGTGQIDAIIESAETEIVISSLVVIETVSAFRRTQNRGEISEAELVELTSAFFDEALSDYVILPLSESLFSFSFGLILDDNLRTLDSLQLSVGLTLDRELEAVSFVTADESLAKVAERRGLDTIVPTGGGSSP